MSRIEKKPEIDSLHTNALSQSVFRIIEVPDDDWWHLDAERDGFLLVSETAYPDRLEPYNLHHPDIAEHFPTLASWLGGGQ